MDYLREFRGIHGGDGGGGDDDDDDDDVERLRNKKWIRR